MKISIEVVGGFAHVTDTDTGAVITGFDHVDITVTPDGAAMCRLGFKTFTAHVVAGPAPQAAVAPPVAAAVAVAVAPSAFAPSVVLASRDARR